jgi:hypothetical protein
MTTYPTVTSQDSYLQALEDMDAGVKGARKAVLTAQQDPTAQLGGLFTYNMFTTPTSTMTPLLLSPMWLDESGPSNPPKFYWNLVFTETPIPPPTTMPTMGTLASRAEIPPAPCYFPPRKKLARKGMLTEAMDLSMFDILNVFQCCWFLSADHLRAQALSAQKAADRKMFWVKFAP